MKIKTTESPGGPVDNFAEIAGNDLNLLYALPYPAAVFRVADGGLTCANHRLYAYLQWPEETVADADDTAQSNLLTASREKNAAGCSLFMRALNEGIVELTSTDGLKSYIEAEVQPILFEGRDSWLVTVVVHATRASSENQGSLDALFHTMVENLNDILYATARDTAVTYISPNISRLCGYEPYEIIGKKIFDFVHPDDVQIISEQSQKLLRGENMIAEYRVMTKTGGTRWVRSSMRPIVRDCRVVGGQGTLADISDYKEVERALKDSYEKYRNVVQNSSDAIFVIQNECVQYMNPIASSILGLPHEAIADKPFWEFVHPDDRALMISRYHLRLRGKSLTDEVQFRFLDNSGDEKLINLKAVAIVWEGQPAVLNFARDITVQKRMEEQLRNSQRIEALGALSNGIVHNFNNLLMGIHGNISLSLTESPPGSPARDYLKKAINLIQSGSKLTRQILGYTKGWNCERDVVDFNQLARETADTFTETHKLIRISYQLCSEIPLIKANKGQMELVLLNLLLNAADAMPDGGGEVTIETAVVKGDQAPGKAALSEETTYVQIKVTDNGSGIPRHISHRVFEPFFTTKNLGKGTGMGLATAHSIVQSHDGEICMSSEPGKGSSFYIYLPMVPAVPETNAAASDSANTIGKGTILLVEDEPAVLEPTASLMEKLGFSVLKAECGLAALDIFQHRWKEIDLVILDMILPRMGGKDLYYKFKEINPQVKVLLSSGYSLASQAEKLIEHGCLGFLQKPYNADTLSSTMLEILSEG